MSLIVIAHNVGDFFPLFRFNLLKVSLPIIIGKPHTCPGIVCHSHLRLIKAKKLLTKFLSHFNSSESTNLNQLSDILCPTFQLSYFSICRTSFYDGKLIRGFWEDNCADVQMVNGNSHTKLFLMTQRGQIFQGNATEIVK